MSLSTIMNVATKTLTNAAEAATTSEVVETAATVTTEATKTAEPVKMSPIVWVIYIAVFGYFAYMMLFAPKKQAKKRKEMIDKLGTGDTVVTNSGIKGKITGETVENDLEFFVLKVDKNTSLTILKGNINKKI